VEAKLGLRGGAGQRGRKEGQGELSRSERERLSTKASRQSTLGYTHGSSLSVDGAQTTNSMVTQDTDGQAFYPGSAAELA